MGSVLRFIHCTGIVGYHWGEKPTKMRRAGLLLIRKVEPAMSLVGHSHRGVGGG